MERPEDPDTGELTEQFYNTWIDAFRASLPETARPVFDRVSRPGKEAAVRRALDVMDDAERRRLINELSG